MGYWSYSIDFKHLRWLSRKDYVRLGILLRQEKSETIGQSPAKSFNLLMLEVV